MIKAPDEHRAPVSVTRGQLWLRCGQTAQDLDPEGFLGFLKQRKPFAHESLAELREHLGALPETQITMPAATFDARGLPLLRSSTSDRSLALGEVAEWRGAGHLLHGAVLHDVQGRSPIVLDPAPGFELAVEEVRVFSLTENAPLHELPHRILRFTERPIGPAGEGEADGHARAYATVAAVLRSRSPTAAQIEEIARSYGRRLEEEGLNEILSRHMLRALRSLRAPEVTRRRRKQGDYDPGFAFGEPYDSAGGAYARLRG